MHEEYIKKYFYVIEENILYVLEICSYYDKTFQCRVTLKRKSSSIFCDVLDYKAQYIVNVAERDVASLELFETLGDALDIGVEYLKSFYSESSFGAEQIL